MRQPPGIRNSHALQQGANRETIKECLAVQLYEILYAPPGPPATTSRSCQVRRGQG